MTTPKPWSPTGLEDFTNCPKHFHEVRILRSIPQTETEEMRWGSIVHKHFEDRQALGTPLPPELVEHEAYMQKMDAFPGVLFTEQQIALDKTAKPCNWQVPDVWMRAKIDWKKVYEEEKFARLVDYKTGKPHQKWKQLMLYAIHTFALHPVDIVDARFYWTKDGTETRKVFARQEVPELWKKFLPDLRQYVEAFKDDVWQARPSGLCGWCPVKSCQHWRPRKPA